MECMGVAFVNKLSLQLKVAMLQHFLMLHMTLKDHQGHYKNDWRCKRSHTVVCYKNKFLEFIVLSYLLQVNVVKGWPVWSLWILSLGFPLHCALLGVSKLLLNLWTYSSRSRGTPHDLHSDVLLLNDRLSRVKVPSLIRRKPRGLNDLKHWKGVYRSWTCYSYSERNSEQGLFWALHPLFWSPVVVTTIFSYFHWYRRGWKTTTSLLF